MYNCNINNNGALYAKILTILKRKTRVTMTIHLPLTIHSGLKCRSQIKILFASILFNNSGVFSLVLRTRRSHSSRAFCFISLVCSPSDAETEGSLNSEILCFPLVGQPKKAQLPPPMHKQQLPVIRLKIPTQYRRKKTRATIKNDCASFSL